MGSEVGPEYVFDQGLYYPMDANYYGYYCTGFESPGDWDSQQSFFGIGSQDPNFSGLQSDNLPYVYYTPSYAYAQSPYNPYNPYIPGAESPYMGSQNFVASPSYQQAVTSPSYIPFLVQSGSEILPVSSPDPSIANTVFPNVNSSSSVSYIPSLVSVNPLTTSQGIRSSIIEPAHYTPIHGKGPGFVAPNKPPPPHGASKPGVISQDIKVKSSANNTQENEHFSYGKDPSVQQSLKVTVPTANGFTNLGSSIRGWDTADKYRPRSFNGMVNNVNGSADLLGEQNRGPRTSRSKGSAIVVRAYTTKAGTVDAEGNITIYRDQYNREDFPIDYPDAKFFVIKSYSEDDVHKSIKYNVWSSTPNGNKRLDGAYEEAQRISISKSRKCPVFLFFSVNASGQFCGVAEMLGPVDFSRDMDFWQQDKWTGSFPIKWHIVKDVPNSSFRHIILENNENKPVTNSRDTQEITYLPGINMLSIFKSSPLRTSILDDFMFYEERQRVAYGERSRLLGRNCAIAVSAPSGPIRSPILPGFHASPDVHALNAPMKYRLESESKQLNGATTQLLKVDRKPRDVLDGGKSSDKMEVPLQAEVGHISANEERPLKAEGKEEIPKVEDQPTERSQELPVAKQDNGVINQHLKSDPNQSDPKATLRPVVEEVGPVIDKVDAFEVLNVKDDAKSAEMEDHGGLPMKISSTSIDSMLCGSNRSTPEIAGGATVDVVTVGSVHIKVKKPTDPGVLTVGSIPIDPKGVKLKMPDGETAKKRRGAI